MKLQDTYPKYSGRIVKIVSTGAEIVVPNDGRDFFRFKDGDHTLCLAPDTFNFEVELVDLKSPIEEAIEREVGDHIALWTRKGFYSSNPPGTCNGDLMSAMRRIVNLTLEEAKRAAWCNGAIQDAGIHPGSERIDTLKIGEPK